MKILICDDNVAVQESLSAYLKMEGIQTELAGSGEEALELLKLSEYDLVVLDIMLPGMDGIEVCRNIRRKSDIPILMLSAKGEENSRIEGLELGADDYVPKPFSPREVTARIRNILKRGNSKNEEKRIYRAAELTLDMSAYEVRINDEKLDFTGREIDMLFYFLQNRGIVLNREQILNAVWGYNYAGDVRAVDTQIKRIRRKLGHRDVHFGIKAVYGIGYKFEVDE